MPMEGMQQWAPTDHPKPLPLGYVKMPGRPRKERRREEGEVRKGTKLSRVDSKSKCSRCHKTGHNTRTCSANPKGNNMKRTLERAKEVLDTNVPRKRRRKAGRVESISHVQEDIRPQKEGRMQLIQLRWLVKAV